MQQRAKQYENVQWLLSLVLLGAAVPALGQAIALGDAPGSVAVPSAPVEVEGEGGVDNTSMDEVSEAAALNSPAPPISNDAALVDDYCIGSGCFTIGDFPDASTSTGYLKLKGTDTAIIFSDTNTTNFPSRDWQITANDGSPLGENFFAIYDNGSSNDSGAFNAAEAGSVPFRIDEAAPTDALRIIGGSGDIGLGTATPADALEILDSKPTIRLSDSSGVEWVINDSANKDVFDLVSTALGSDPVRHLFISRNSPADRLVLQPEGVGIGRFAPEAPLDVEGDAIVRGDLSVLSSRDAKTDFSDAASEELLKHLAELPILSWRYKHEETGTKHLGPVAQDFYSAFGLGAQADFVSPMDGVGVALATIQALDRRGRRMADAL
ncbi:MAG: tail fiber domain-containing protein, partial [Pseudomonadota bacterium]